MVILDRRQSADAGAHRYSDPMAVFFGDFEPGIPERIDARGNAVVHEDIHAPGIFLLQVLGNIEVRNRTRDLRRKRTDIEVLELPKPGTTLTDILPGGFDLVANRRNDPHAGYYDTSLTQEMIRIVVAELPSSMNGFEKLVQRSSTAPT